MTVQEIAVRAAPLTFVFLWSTGFIGAKYGLPYAEPNTFLFTRMEWVVAIHALLILATRAPWPTRREAAHSAVVGLLVHGVYLGGVFFAIGQGVPAGVAALIVGLQPILTSTLASRWLGETVTRLQWLGLALGLAGVALVLHDRAASFAGSPLGYLTNVAALLGITVGTLYQKRYCGNVDWRTGNLFQYLAAAAFFGFFTLVFETRSIVWSGEFVFALAWLVLVLSIASVALMYWLLRRAPAAGFASLMYLVPVVTALIAYVLFGEKLDALSIAGMFVVAAGVLLVNRGASKKGAA